MLATPDLEGSFMGALTGIRVVDFTRVVGGPYCTMQLGDLGAEVLKIEEPGHGEDSRSFGPPFVQDETPYFLSLNRNKKSVTLDLRQPRGAELARALIAQSDIVMEGFRPGTMARFGLEYERLSVDHPSLIYCSLSGWGESGPYADRAGYDVMVSALAGLMAITGPVGGPPVKVGVPLLHHLAGLQACSAILTALFHRERTGRGQRIHLSLLSTQLATLVNAASNYLISGVIPEPQGSSHGSIVPYRSFPTADGHILIGAANDKLFACLCRGLDHPEWLDDPRYRTNGERVANRVHLEVAIEAALAADTTARWVERLAAVGVAVAPVNRMDQVFRDPQVVHSGQVVSVQHPTLGPIPLVGPTVSYSETPAEVSAPPPLLGQHTREILRDLAGLDEGEAERLAAQGVI